MIRRMESVIAASSRMSAGADEGRDFANDFLGILLSLVEKYCEKQSLIQIPKKASEQEHQK